MKATLKTAPCLIAATLALAAAPGTSSPPPARPAVPPPAVPPPAAVPEGTAGNGPTADRAPAARYTYVHHPVSTDIPAAQFAFDRGLTMVFAYQPDEAELAFKEAARLDPGLAMAWWGIALAKGPNINVQPEAGKTADAAEALKRASRLAQSRATDGEREYISTLAARYTSDRHPDFDRLAVAYRDAMRALVLKHPEDSDARAFLAEAIMDLHPWRLWTSQGEPAPGTPELIQVLEEGLQRDPGHIGLLHFYIHAVEASTDPARALPIANRLAALPMEPAASHLVHMPAHIYMRVGDWESAVQANEHAVHHALDYRLTNNPQAQSACGHCADFLSYAYMMQGNQAHARQSADNYLKLSGDPTNALAVLVRFRQWRDVLAFPPAERGAASGERNSHAVRGFRDFARGLAFAGTGELDRAQGELDALRSETALAPAPVDFSGPLAVAHINDRISQSIDASALRIAAAILGSRIAEARHRMQESITLMRQAVQLQDETTYSEPPPWFYPVRESLGALLLRSGSIEEAEDVFRESLRRTPNDPRALLGLSRSLAAAGREAEAAQARSNFAAAWRYSDVQIRLEDL